MVDDVIVLEKLNKYFDKVKTKPKYEPGDNRRMEMQQLCSYVDNLSKQTGEKYYPIIFQFQSAKDYQNMKDAVDLLQKSYPSLLIIEAEFYNIDCCMNGKDFLLFKMRFGDPNDNINNSGMIYKHPRIANYFIFNLDD